MINFKYFSVSTKTKAETLADLNKQRDTKDEDMEETETGVVPEEQQETAMETEQVK